MNASAESEPVESERYYQVVFIWTKDAEKFGRYAKLVAPLVEPYGGRLDRQLHPASLFGEGVTRPDMVNLVSNPDREL